MKISATKAVMECLLEQDVDTVFGYPGGTILNLYDELYRYKDRIRHVLTAHEQGAAHAADGYARSTGVVLRLLLSDGSQKRFTQVRHEHRLRAECGHAGVPHLLFNIRPVIGGEYIMMNKSCRHILLLGTAGFIWHCQPNGAALH